MIKSPQTKSFLVLILALGILSAAVLYLSKTQTEILGSVDNQVEALQTGINKVADKEISIPAMSEWVEYSDSGVSLKFKYPPTWKLSTYDSENPKYYIIVLDPGQEKDHIRIYVSKKSYFADQGLTKEKTKVAGQEAWTVQDLLVGVKTSSQYFTFDLGSNLELKPAFQDMLTTVALNQ